MCVLGADGAFHSFLLVKDFRFSLAASVVLLTRRYVISGLMEDTRRKCTSVRQLDLMITFMEAHTNFAVGQLRSKEGRALSTRMWERCAEILNSEGVVRTPKDWSKVSF